MGNKDSQLSLERARHLLAYDPASGELRWAVTRSGVRAGALAGSQTEPTAISLRVDGRRFLAHRIIWLLAYGEWPPGFIDHADGNPHNNRLANLRIATFSQNAANKRAVANSSSGLKGVTWHKRAGKWQAAVKLNGKNHHIGLFLTPEEAHTAYMRKAREVFGDFARPA